MLKICKTRGVGRGVIHARILSWPASPTNPPQSFLDTSRLSRTCSCPDRGAGSPAPSFPFQRQVQRLNMKNSVADPDPN